MADGTVNQQAFASPLRMVRHAAASAGASTAVCARPRARGLVAGQDAVRGVPRRDPDPEHRLDQRREGARRRCGRAGCCRIGALRRAAGRAARAADPLVRHFNVKARRARARSSGFLGREYGGRVAGDAARDARGAAREAAGRAGDRPRDRRLDRALRRRPAALRRRRLHAPGLLAAGTAPGREPYDEVQRFFMDRLPRDVGALQRLPRPDRAARQGRLPDAAALRALPARNAVSSSRV